MKSLWNCLILVALACQSAPAAQEAVHVTLTGTQDAARTSGFSQLTVNDDVHGALSLTLQRDGSLSAQLDGAELPADRVVRNGDRLRVLGTDGALLYELQVLGDNLGLAYPYGEVGARRVMRFGSSAFPALAELEALKGTSFPFNKPRRVIGVITTPVDGALVAQLGLKPESAVIINEVTPGMPAEQAGLQPFDVITHIGGSAPVTREVLRERIAATEVGQPLQLTLLRRGQPLEISVLVGETTDADGMLPRYVFGGVHGDGEGVWDSVTAYQLDAMAGDGSLARAQAELDAAAATLHERISELHAQAAQGGAAGESAARAQEALETALARLLEAQASMQQRSGSGSPAVSFFSLGEGGDKGLLLQRPPVDGVRSSWRNAAGAQPAAPSDERLKQMEERLAALDARVAELVKALEAANARP